MIVVTGGAGFIGSCLVWKLNECGKSEITIVDDFADSEKWKNLRKRKYYDTIPIDVGRDWVKDHASSIEAVFHMGACSTTTETDFDYLMDNNVHYSVDLFETCAANGIPFIYASSAATYGIGDHGYSDEHAGIGVLKPINRYGYSKQLFDTWVLKQNKFPPYWCGLKFFNVYGPQEYHKGAQASVVYHAFPQVRDEQCLKLFKSYKDGVDHGEQQRDFVYVKDTVELMMHILGEHTSLESGIYNVGTGQARSFADLGKSVFAAMDSGEANFEWIDMPENVKNQYQYFTQAEMAKVSSQLKYSKAFTTLEDGVKDYLQNYLMTEDPYL